MVKSLEFFNNLGNQYMITEIKNFSNKTLKDIMIERLYKKIVLQMINNINLNDLNVNFNEAIRKIRNELKDFFSELHSQTKIMKNLGDTLCDFFDKNNLVSFDDIMEKVNFKNKLIVLRYFFFSK